MVFVRDWSWSIDSFSKLLWSPIFSVTRSLKNANLISSRPIGFLLRFHISFKFGYKEYIGCRWSEQTARERADNPTSYAEDKKDEVINTSYPQLPLKVSLTCCSSHFAPFRRVAVSTALFQPSLSWAHLQAVSSIHRLNSRTGLSQLFGRLLLQELGAPYHGPKSSLSKELWITGTGYHRV